MKRFLVRLAMPIIVAWARSCERKALAVGEPLSAQGLADARALGVHEAERIRVLTVEMMPFPLVRLYCAMADHRAALVRETAGLSLRYGIYVRQDCREDRWLIAHECVHTAQYERLGGMAAFLTEYLVQCWELGYPAAELEQEALLKTAQLRQESQMCETPSGRCERE